MEKNDREISKVYETKNYDKFVFYEWNRDIQQSTLNKIHKSVMEHGWKIEPIIVNEEMGIIDGQHRFTYAKEHQLPIYYVIIKGLTKDDCQIMNSVRTSWKTTDYINFYAIQGNQNYSNLMILDTTYKDFNLGVIVYATSGKLAGGSSTGLIMNGEYVCNKKQYNTAIEVLDYLSNISNYIKQIKGRKTQLCQAIIFCIGLEKTDKDRLARKIGENCNSINPPVDFETALQELERIYNYKLQKENQIYFTTEWKKRK